MTSIAPELTETPDEDDAALPPTADVATDGNDGPDYSDPKWDMDADDEEDDDEPIEAEEPAEADVSADATPEPAEPVADAAPAPEPAPEPIPAVVDYEGGSYTIPGAFFDPKTGGLRFESNRAAQRSYTLMKHGAWYEAVGRRQMETLEKRLSTEVEAARTDAREFLDALMGSADLPEQEFIDRMLAFKAQAPELRFQMQLSERDRKIAELEGRSKQPETFPEPAPEHLQDWAESQAAENIRTDAARFPWMTPECVAELTATMQHPDTVARYVRTADATVAATGQVKLGQPYIDWRAYYAIAKPIAKAWENAHTKSAEAKANAAKSVQTLQKTAQTNGKILAKVTPAAPKPNIAPVAPALPETDEEAEERARNELGQFIRQAAQSSRVRVRR